MQDILAQLQSVLQGNPTSILATLTSGSLIVWLVSNIKTIWNNIVNAVLLCISFTIENFYEDNRSNDGIVSRQQNAFNEIVSNSKAIFERTKNMDLSQSAHFMANLQDSRGCNTNLDSISQSSLTFGFSIRIINHRIVFCNRVMNTGGQKTMISTSLRVFFANKEKFIEGFEKMISERLKESYDMMMDKPYVNIYNGFTTYGVKTKRDLDSIFTNGNEHMRLYEQIRSFIDNHELYKSMNYPYKFCGLLYGSPGTGKTSTILSIASRLNYNIRYVSMTDLNLRELLEAINEEYNGNTLYVIEDIDAFDTKMNSSRDSDDKNRISTAKREEMSLSDLLNVTDGLLSSDGLILLFTTNHIEKLDDAFLRSGRMNCKVKFDYLNHETADRMIRHHLGYGIDNLRDDIKPTELQDMILDIKLGKSTKEELIGRFCKDKEKDKQDENGKIA